MACTMKATKTILTATKAHLATAMVMKATVM